MTFTPTHRTKRLLYGMPGIMPAGTLVQSLGFDGPDAVTVLCITAHGDRDAPWRLAGTDLEPLTERQWNRNGEYTTETRIGPFTLRVELVTLESPCWEGGKRGMHTAVTDAEWSLGVPGTNVASGYLDTRNMPEAQRLALIAVADFLDTLKETL